MTLQETIKQHLHEAIINKEEVRKTILRVALGDLQRNSSTKYLTKEEELRIIRKLVEGNKETISFTKDEEKKMILENEIVILESYLPRNLSEQEVRDFLVNVDLTAKSTGASLGLAMKAFKQAGLSVDANMVKKVVEDGNNKENNS